MTTIVHSVNERGSDEYSVHIVGEHTTVVCIFRKATKATNRRNAITRARQIAMQMRRPYAMSHNLSAAACSALLPVEFR